MSCSGCGSDVMLRRRLSLLTKSTRVPCGTVSSLGLIPVVLIVKTYGFDGGGGVVGALPPPHADRTTSAPTEMARRTMGMTGRDYDRSGPLRLSDVDASLEIAVVGIVVVVKTADPGGRQRVRRT